MKKTWMHSYFSFHLIVLFFQKSKLREVATCQKAVRFAKAATIEDLEICVAHIPVPKPKYFCWPSWIKSEESYANNFHDQNKRPNSWRKSARNCDIFLETSHIFWIFDKFLSMSSKVKESIMWGFFFGVRSWTFFRVTLKAFIPIQMNVWSIQNDYLDHVRHVWDIFGTIRPLKIFFCKLHFRKLSTENE